MPYIKNERRVALANEQAQTAGELNYEFTILAMRYVDLKGLNYQTIADILSAFDGASKEFYRRVAAPYEDTKIVENGDVY